MDLAILCCHAVHLFFLFLDSARAMVVRCSQEPAQSSGAQGCYTSTCKQEIVLLRFWRDFVHLTLAPLTGGWCLPAAWPFGMITCEDIQQACEVLQASLPVLCLPVLDKHAIVPPHLNNLLFVQAGKLRNPNDEVWGKWQV